MSIFLEKLKDSFNITTTENGAKAYTSTKSAVLDLFYLGGAARRLTKEQRERMVLAALTEDRVLAAKVILYLGDIREGQGERDMFRIGIRQMLKYFNREEIIKLIPEYSLWKVVVELFGESVEARKVVATAFAEGNDALLYKWLPSVRAHKKYSNTAKGIIKYLGITAGEYRAVLSAYRTEMNLVEKNLSTKNYSAIDYNKVPSKAGMLYRTAFHKHDGERYTAHVNKAIEQAKAVKAGTMSVKEVTAKVNVKTLYPHEIVAKYCGPWFGNDAMKPKDFSAELEAMWESLPDYVKGIESSTLVVGDRSGSMDSLIDDNNKSVCAAHVSTALSVYFSERLVGPFKNNFILFSEEPVLNQLTGNTLFDKLRSMRMDNARNTNLQAVFDVILSTALRNRLPQSELPQNLLIISDMEFDRAYGGNLTNLEAARIKFNAAGYVLPTIVFWNVTARNEQVPAKMNDNGVVLVSGYSPSVIKFILIGEIKTPKEMMLTVLNTPRYSIIDEIVNK